jgi:hypothetical protein
MYGIRWMQGRTHHKYIGGRGVERSRERWELGRGGGGKTEKEREVGG